MSKICPGQLEALLFGRLLAVTDDLVFQTLFVCTISLILALATWKEQVFRAFDPVAFQLMVIKFFGQI